VPKLLKGQYHEKGCEITIFLLRTEGEPDFASRRRHFDVYLRTTFKGMIRKI
jgi:hypothetical protein